MKTYRATVLQIRSRRKNDRAEIRFVRGNKVTITQIEIGRLIAAKVAYCGAAFYVHISDRGATRTIRIVPNKAANKKAAERVAKLLAREASETRKK